MYYMDQRMPRNDLGYTTSKYNNKTKTITTTILLVRPPLKYIAKLMVASFSKEEIGKRIDKDFFMLCTRGSVIISSLMRTELCTNFKCLI